MTLQPEKNVILPTMNTVFLDIEADGLNPTKIHCVVTKRSNETHWTYLSRWRLIDKLARGGKVCRHPHIGNPMAVMRKLWGNSVTS